MGTPNLFSQLSTMHRQGPRHCSIDRTRKTELSTTRSTSLLRNKSDSSFVPIDVIMNCSVIYRDGTSHALPSNNQHRSNKQIKPLSLNQVSTDIEMSPSCYVHVHVQLQRTECFPSHLIPSILIPSLSPAEPGSSNASIFQSIDRPIMEI